MNYYPFHIGDFRSGTVNMSRQTRWIYRDMIDVYYDTERPLSADLDILCDEIGADSEEERRIVEKLLRFKFVKTDSGYEHEICDKVIAEYRQKAETAKTNGKLGGRPRKPSGFQSGSDQVATGNLKQTELEANQEPLTNNHKPVKEQKTAPIGDLFVGIDLQVVSDFEEMRKKQRAPITQTAIKGIQREADKAGISLADALVLCVERSWRGFKADWVKGPPIAAEKQSRHNGFEKIDYSEGVTKDGRIA